MLNVWELFEKLWWLAIFFTEGGLVVDCQCIACMLMPPDIV